MKVPKVYEPMNRNIKLWVPSFKFNIILVPEKCPKNCGGKFLPSGRNTTQNSVHKSWLFGLNSATDKSKK